VVDLAAHRACAAGLRRARRPALAVGLISSLPAIVLAVYSVVTIVQYSSWPHSA
jgi:hypothetical protein